MPLRPRRHFAAVCCLLVLSAAGQRAVSSRYAPPAPGDPAVHLGTFDEEDAERAVLLRLAADLDRESPVTLSWQERSGRFLLAASVTYRPEEATLTAYLDGQRAVYRPVTAEGIARAVALPRTRSFTGAMALSARP